MKHKKSDAVKGEEKSEKRTTQVACNFKGDEVKRLQKVRETFLVKDTSLPAIVRHLALHALSLWEQGKL